KARHIFVTRSVFQLSAAGFFIFNASGEMDIVPSGTAGGGNIALAFDRAGNLYVAESVGGSVRIFKNDVFLASLTDTGIGQMGADCSGNLYLTDPFVSPRIFRIDQGRQGVTETGTPVSLPLGATDWTPRGLFQPGPAPSRYKETMT